MKRGMSSRVRQFYTANTEGLSTIPSVSLNPLTSVLERGEVHRKGDIIRVQKFVHTKYKGVL